MKCMARTCIQLKKSCFVYRLNNLKGNDVALYQEKTIRAFEKEVAGALLTLSSSTARSSGKLSLAKSLLSLSVEKIDAIDANE